ncbi:STAS domain-containing protein [Flagellimonas allohymeniacidonis]|uniref:STAS domain-containing protein n=1 Tax=Flagellimonas allohymeniacidonis TaxID=2517819 RepID=A0A4Q8QAA1_9FLAO|nr:STAS domain-containing protein [Allomuricauda hymeniacidonis]TAI47161.1 STAS domain-containing protein [Allomuricauda hymeniacidonis]
MSLEIRENRGVFEVMGKVSTQHINSLGVYFDSILESHDTFVVSLEKVTSLDAAAAHFFEKLYQKSAQRNKAVFLIGRQNETVLETMNTTKTNYILSADRV